MVVAIDLVVEGEGGEIVAGELCSGNVMVVNSYSRVAWRTK